MPTKRKLFQTIYDKDGDVLTQMYVERATPWQEIVMRENNQIHSVEITFSDGMRNKVEWTYYHSDPSSNKETM